jgi:hypothetical protein
MNAVQLSIQALRIISERDPQSDVCGPDAPSKCATSCIGCIARRALQRIGAPNCSACGEVMVWGTVCTPEWNGIGLGSAAKVTIRKEPGWMCTRCAGVMPRTTPAPPYREHTQWPCWCGEAHSNSDLR